MSPKSTVGVSLLTTGLLITASQVLNKKMPTYRQLVGVCVVYLFLGVGAEITPEVAAAFSVLVVVVVFFETFGQVAPQLEKFFGAKPTGTKRLTVQGYTDPMGKGH